ncbi:protein of unknown function [Pseudomonas mediterranea]
MVEHDLAKVGVASSSLVSRSKIKKKATQMSGFFCACARHGALRVSATSLAVVVSLVTWR